MGVEPFISDVDACLQIWFGGQEGTNAVADVLSGQCSPSGRLPFTVPKRFEDNPTYSKDGRQFPGMADMKTQFDENLLIGYRHYDATEHGSKVRFPFGFGLSYTSFSVAYQTMDPTIARFDVFTSKFDQNFVKVSATVENTGHMRGAEVVQVYVGPSQPAPGRPAKELVAFQKVWLDPSESSDVYVEFDVRRTVEFFKVQADEKGQTGKWTVPINSSFNIFLGTSATDAKQVATFKVEKPIDTTVYDN